MKSLTQADQQPAFSPPAILVVEPARPLPIHSSLQERKLTMNSNTHPDPFPTLPPPHACRVKLNHSKIIPRKMGGSCTRFRPLAAFPPHLVPTKKNGRCVYEDSASPAPSSQPGMPRKTGLRGRCRYAGSGYLSPPIPAGAWCRGRGGRR